MPRRRERVQVTYRASFQSAFHCGTGLPAGLIDRTVQRDQAGFLVVPGSTIKGAVRERCERLARLLGQKISSPHGPDGLADLHPMVGSVHALFGSRRQPGGLFFDDATLTPEQRSWFAAAGGSTMDSAYRRGQIEERTRVSLGRLTGTAQPGALFTSEYGIRGLVFDGSIAGVVEDWSLLEGENTFGLVLLTAGLLAVDSLGANRSAGTGRCALTIQSIVAAGIAVDPAQLLSHLEEFSLYDLIAKEG